MKKILITTILCFTSILVSVAAEQEIEEQYDDLLSAIAYNYREEVAELLKKEPRLNRYMESGALRRAVKLGYNLGIIKMLLEAGASPNDIMPNESQPLLEAVKHRNPQLVKLLLKYKAKVDYNKWEALKEAINNDDRAIMPILKEVFAECVKAKNCNPMLYEN